MANNYDINYNDDRFQKVEAAKNTALNEVDKTYGEMISQSDSYFDKQIAASEKWADKQTELQNQKTDQAIKEINQQKDQAKKDYTREQSGAYVDWQKQSNEYGVNSEKVAAGGLQNTGFAESSQVSMYNTYQNRVATAREAYVQAVQNYDNAIANARLQNSSILAEIAYEALHKQLELSLQGFQYKNQLIIDKANKKTQLDSEYYSRYQDVLKQINTENALAEEIRQYNQNYKLEVQKYQESVRQFNQEYALQKDKFQEEIRQFDEEIARLKANDAHEHKMEIQKLELQKKQVQQAQDQWEAEMQLEKNQLAEEQRQFNEELKLKKNDLDGNGGKKGTSSSGSRNAPSVNKGRGGNVIREVNDSDKTNNNDPIITNRHGDSWIEIPGHGRFSYTELEAHVNDGTIKETISNGKATYKWVTKKRTGSGNITPDAKGYAAKQKDLMRKAW